MRTFPNAELGCRTHGISAHGKPGVLWTHMYCEALCGPVCGMWAHVLSRVCVTNLPHCQMVSEAPRLWAPDGYCVQGPEFLCVLLCSRDCGVLPPGQPGVWGISLSTA